MGSETRLAYRPEQAAIAMGCSRDTIFRLLAADELQGFKVGSSRFIAASELEAFILARQEGPTPLPHRLRS